MKLINLLVIIILSCLTFSSYAIGDKVTWEELDWKVIRSENFDIYFPVGYERLGQTTQIYCEEANILLSQKLGHNLSQIIPVFVYPSHSHFQMTNIIFSKLDEGIGGFTERIKKRVVVPYMGSQAEFRHVITHELVHAFQYDILLGSGFGGLLAAQYAPNPPLWLVEGMAEYLSIKWDKTSDMAMRDAVVSSSLPTLEQMTMMQVQSGYMLYKGGQAVMKFIAETWGEKKIGELLKDARDQRNIEDAIKVNFGIDFDEFDTKWRLWVRRKYSNDVHKRVDEEEAVLLSRHAQDESFLNLHPTLSPDGKKVAYLSIRKFFPVIVLRDAKPLKKKLNYKISTEEETPDEEVVIVSTNNYKFEQLHLLDNRLSFTKDSKSIFFVARAGGKDHLYLYNIEKKSVTKNYIPPLDMVQYPRLSYDNKYAVFVGSILGQTDVYFLTLASGAIKKITSDYFSERDPAISGDNSLIVFSSNRNEENNYESRIENLFEYNLATKQLTKIKLNGPNVSSPTYYYQNQNNRILYTSNTNGIFNAYIYDKDTQEELQLTNVSGGVFNVQTDKKAEKLLFTMYRHQGYDIAIKAAPSDPSEIVKSKKEVYNYPDVNFPIYVAGNAISLPEIYHTRVTPDQFFFGFNYSSTYGFGGFTQMSLSDYLGNHQIRGYFDYLSNRQALNFDVSYGYLKKRMNFYLSVFRSQNFYSIFSLTDVTTINDFLYNPNSFVNSVNNYGARAIASYPFSPFFKIDTGLEISRLEEDFSGEVAPTYKRPDIYTNIYATSISASYNNVLYSIIGPIKGLSLKVSDEQTMNLSGREQVINRQTFDARYYFHLGSRYVLALRTLGGNVSGPDRGFHPWQMGGFDTIRGFSYLEFQGQKMFLGNVEIRFPLVNAIAFGFPVPWVIQGFSGVFFFDMGGAYNAPDQFKGIRNGRLIDFKLSYGTGLRFILFPGVMIKIDWATPWDFQESLPLALWQGTFSMGYEY